MASDIRMATTPDEIKAYIQTRLERLTQALVYRLAYVGEQAVNKARSLPSPKVAPVHGRIPPHQPNYIDHTVNLRNSIGYMVAVEGREVRSGGWTDGTEGGIAGRSMAERVAARHPHSVVLIVTAGERYAAYVAALHYDVIDSAVLLAKRLLPGILKELGLK